MTEFGSTILLTALSLVTCLRLFIDRRRLVALTWIASLLLLIGSVTALKIYFAACQLTLFNIRSPSGHVALSTFVYGSIGLILAAGQRHARQAAITATVVLWVMTIAVSRVVLHAHTVSEVVAGGFLGAAVLSLFAMVHLRLRPVRFVPSLIDLAVVIPVIAATHHYQLRSAPIIYGVSEDVGHRLFCI